MRSCGRPRCNRPRRACPHRRRRRPLPRRPRLRPRRRLLLAAKAPEPAPAPKAPDIALEREKKLKEQKEQKERELEQQQQQKKKELEAKQRAEDDAQRKKEQQQKLADQKKQQEADAKQAEAKKAEAAAKQAAADRAATLKRMQGLAGASGADDAKGNALRSSGPSSGYAGRIAAAVSARTSPSTCRHRGRQPHRRVRVNLAPDGTIVGVKLTRSSGLPAWDEAAERGLHKTDKLPRDIDGRIFPSLIVTLRPK
jgi:colicin import membrane protein